jgi:hypothetical protein
VTARTALTNQPRVPDHSGVEAVSFDGQGGSNAHRSYSRADSTNEVERICQTFYELDGTERARVLRALSVPLVVGSSACLPCAVSVSSPGRSAWP